MPGGLGSEVLSKDITKRTPIIPPAKSEPQKEAGGESISEKGGRFREKPR